MPRLAESPRDTGRIVFELDRFELAGDDRLELRGRWFGVRGRRFVRPTLVLFLDGERSRLLADLEHKPWLAEEGEPWQAAFPCGVPSSQVREAELAVASDILIPLPAPSRRHRGPERIPAQGRPEPSAPPAPARDELAEARKEIELLRAELEDANASRLEALAERDRSAGEREQAQAAATRACEERDRARAAQESAREERDQAARAQEESTAQRDQALDERAAAAEAEAQMAAQRDAAESAREEALALREQALQERQQALDERDRALRERDDAVAELDTQRQVVQRMQAEREAEATARGAAIVMQNATRAAPLGRRGFWRRRS